MSKRSSEGTVANIITDPGATIRSSTRIIVQSFFTVSDDFAKWETTATARRCRSMALRYHGFYQAAIDEANRGLGKATAEERFDLHNRIGRTYFGMSEDNPQTSNEELVKRKDNLRNALHHFEEALKEKSILGDNELQKKKLGRTYQLKAKIEMFLDKPSAALSSSPVQHGSGHSHRTSPK